MNFLFALRDALDPSLFWEYRSILWRGLLYNIGIFAVSALGATSVGLVIAICRMNRLRTVRVLASGYAEFFRNAPEYILLVWVYYVLPVVLTRVFGTRVSIDPLVAAVATLTVTYSGYLSETFRAGIQAVPRSHTEAAMSLGMGRWQIMCRITVPQAVRHVLPESLNQFISLFKSTSFVSLIAIEDLMYRVSMITMEESRPLPLYTWAALVFCVIIFACTQLTAYSSNRWRQRGMA